MPLCKICGKDCYVGDDVVGFINGIRYSDVTYECRDCRFDIAAKKAEEIKNKTGKQICLTCYAESNTIHYL